MSAEDPIADNPFYVLELRPGATSAEIERAGQKLAAMLGVGITAAARYETPIGPRTRDAALVRRAVDQLRDPAHRWRHELWARVAPQGTPEEAAPIEGWPEPLESLGAGRGRGRQNRQSSR